MINGFLGLRHDAVIRGHNQHHDVCYFRPTRTHARERFVARRIHKNHAALVHHHFVRPDVLRDSTGFACGNICFADRIQKARFPVVHMTHDRHHRRPRLQTFFGLFLCYLEYHFFFKRDHAHHATERFRERRRRRHVERLVDAGKHPSIQQSL